MQRRNKELQLLYRMQNSSNKESQSAAESLSPLVFSCSSLWNTTEQAKYSPPKSIVTSSASSPNFLGHVKKSESQFQEQDSSSTLPTCQSHYAMGNTARNNSIVQDLGLQHANQKRSSPPYGNADYAFGQVQFDYSHSVTCIPYQWAESCVGAIVGGFGPNALVYPQMLGINQARVPIPLDSAESIPVYVNAKQFRAILRRRQTRAKLEAQNKIVKSRKPYLHESRHRHALKRERGPGGRFLNAKDNQQSKPSLPKYFEGISCQQLDRNVSGTEVQKSDSGSWETSTQSGSDVTSIFSGDDIFQQSEIKLSRSPFHMDTHIRNSFTQLEAGNGLFLSIDGCAPK